MSMLKEINTLTLPCHIEAEQMLLGAMLRDNSICEKLADLINEKVFFDYLHQRLYAQIIKTIKQGLVADEVSLKMFFDNDPALINSGGSEYLLKIQAKASIVFNLNNVAKILQDAYIRRKIISIAKKISSSAYDYDADNPGITQLEQVVNEVTKELQEIDKQSSIKQDIKPIKLYVQPYFDYLKELVENKNRLQGISTGIEKLDILTGGFKPGELVILAARTSIGKTSVALYFMLENLKNTDGYICFFSLEMSANQLLNRLVGIQTDQTINECLNKEPADVLPFIMGINTLAEQKILIDNSGSMNITQLKRKIIVISQQYNLKCVYIDYLQLLKGTTGTENRTVEVTEISKTLKEIARELNIPVVALGQISRKVEDRQNKRPQLADLRESGSIEQDADIVLLLYRENYYKKDAPNTLEINVAKNRSGSTGTVTVDYCVSTGKIY